MRKLFWQQMASLDGFMEGPNRELDWFVTDDEFGRYVADMGTTIDTIVFGRVTWQMMASYWPKSTEPEAPMMNELPKVVFSKTLKKLDEWQGSRLAKGTVDDEINALKRQPGKDIAMFGSSDLASTLLRHRLLDEIRIFVNPVVLGRGHPLFKDVKEKLSLELVSARPFRSGNVLVIYRPA
ncbi:MAG TPA: dihydrofolate reductase family protein [Haliangiales bacterium]|nr:dihydrofolate reductase family protein [Haliangiales bacterium]